MGSEAGTGMEKSAVEKRETCETSIDETKRAARPRGGGASVVLEDRLVELVQRRQLARLDEGELGDEEEEVAVGGV